MFDLLREGGVQVEFHSHAEAILGVALSEVADQLEAILLRSTIPIEIIGAGGWRDQGTQ